MSTYSIENHRHRFAAWCAASAASASPGCRFPAKAGFSLIEQSGLVEAATNWSSLPPPSSFDYEHRGWRDTLVRLAPSVVGHGPKRNFTHGVAAKLINCYLKPLFICGVPENPNGSPTSLHDLFDAIHPPIDRLLLDKLSRGNVAGKGKFWRQHRDIGWSSFTSEQYEAVISAVREATGGQLWRIEEHWIGFQPVPQRA
jgi:hypothetical protein